MPPASGRFGDLMDLPYSHSSSKRPSPPAAVRKLAVPLFLLLLVAGVGGCSGFLPESGPGREAIREYSRHVMASPLRLEDFEVAELYQTPDPEVVITEMRTRGTVTTTGRPFTTTSVQILRIREGRIVHSRDFADPRILEDAIGDQRPGS